VLKEGRSVSEIKSFLYFPQLLTGIGVVAFAIQFAIDHAGLTLAQSVRSLQARG
jgi:hypothetical protein